MNVKRVFKALLIIITVMVIFSCNSETPVSNVVSVYIDYKDGSTVRVQDIIQGNIFPLPATPKKEKSIFTGWYLSDGTKLEVNPVVRQNMTIEAHWFDLPGEIFLNTYPGTKAIKTQGTPIAFSYDVSACPVNTNWVWKVNGKNAGNNPALLSLDSANMEGDYRISIEANETEAASFLLTITRETVYSIIYIVGDMKKVESGFSVGLNITPKSISELGGIIPSDNVFNQWEVISPNSLTLNPSGDFSMPSCDVILRAKFTEKKYRVDINADEGFILNPSVIENKKNGEYVTLPSVSGNDWFDAVWYLDGNEITGGFTINGKDVVLTLKKELMKKNILIDSASFTIDPISIDPQRPGVEVKLPLVQSEAADGYEFLWLMNETPVSGSFNMPNSDVTLRLTVQGKLYSIAYILDGWTLPNNIKTWARYGESLSIPSPSKEGMNFTGWKIDNEGTLSDLPSTMPNKDIVLRPVGEARSVNIMVIHQDTDGNRLEEESILDKKYGDTIIFKDIEYDNVEYYFASAECFYSKDGFSYDHRIDCSSDSFNVPSGNVMLYMTYAKFEKKPVGGVIYYDIGPSISNAEYIFYKEDGEKITYTDNIAVLKDAAFYIKKGIGEDRFLVVYPELISRDKLQWGFNDNNDICDYYRNANVKVATGLEIGYGKSATEKILRYIEQYCQGDNEKKLYKNGKKEVEYVWDVLSYKLTTFSQDQPNDYWIPSRDELVALVNSVNIPDNIKLTGVYDAFISSSSTNKGTQYYIVRLNRDKNSGLISYRFQNDITYYYNAVMIRSV